VGNAFCPEQCCSALVHLRRVLFIPLCIDPTPRHFSTAWAKCRPHYSVLPCMKGSQQACVTAVTPTKICSSYSCAVAQHQGIAALPGQNAVPTGHLSPNRIGGQAQHAQECIVCIPFTVFLCCRLLGLHEQQQGSKRQGCHAC